MKRMIAVVALMLLAGMAIGQQQTDSSVYTQRGLELLGIEIGEIESILQFQQEASFQIRRHRADQEIKKAELARLLLEEEPNMRLVERNLQETAGIDVEVRMVEIRREISIRRIIGMDRWALMIRALRARRVQSAQELAGQASAQMRELLQIITEKQRDLIGLGQNRRENLSNEDIRRQYQQLQQHYLELQRLIRERL